MARCTERKPEQGSLTLPAEQVAEMTSLISTGKAGADFSVQKPSLSAVGEPQLTAVFSGAMGKDGFLAGGQRREHNSYWGVRETHCAHGCPSFRTAPHGPHQSPPAPDSGGLRCVGDRKGQEPGIATLATAREISQFQKKKKKSSPAGLHSPGSLT